MTWREMPWSGHAVDLMAMEDPENFYRMLRGFITLLGDSRPWWRATSNGDHQAWPSAVRSAITDVARKCALTPKDLAVWLDERPLPKTRARVLTLATEKFTNGLR